jgi:hypothetical protein
MDGRVYSRLRAQFHRGFHRLTRACFCGQIFGMNAFTKSVEDEWLAMRKKSMGELIETKLSAQSGIKDKLLAEMELDRRKFVRDVKIDRIVSIIALLTAIVALSTSRCHISKPPDQSQSAAMQLAPTPALPTNTASIPQSASTNKLISTNVQLAKPSNASQPTSTNQ